MRRLLRVAVVAAVLLAIGATVFYYPGPGVQGAPAPPCGAALLVGLRGNGDALDGDQGMGADTLAVVRAFAARRQGVTAVAYPYTTGLWWRIGGHMRSTTAALTAYLAGRHRRCPGERLLLVGQSEGAGIVHLALPALGSQLAGAVLVADPLRLASSPYDVIRSSNDGVLTHLLLGRAGGVGPPRDVVPAALTAAVRSYCLHADPVCDPSSETEVPGIRDGVHQSYRNNAGVVAMAADFLASRFQ
jgi:hypothetical protein